MSVIYDLLQAYAEQTENVRRATKKIEDQNADISHLLKHNSALEAALAKQRDEIRELNERVECEEENAGRWRAEYEKAQSNYLRVVRHQDGQTQEISDLQDANARLLVALDRLRTKNEALQADNAAKAAYILSGKNPLANRYRALYFNQRDAVKRAARNRQLKAERWKAKRRKRELKRKYGGDLSVANWESSYNITQLYRQWQRLRTMNPPLAQAIRERLDEWKEAHRVKTP